MYLRMSPENLKWLRLRKVSQFQGLLNYFLKSENFLANIHKRRHKMLLLRRDHDVIFQTLAVTSQ